MKKCKKRIIMLVIAFLFTLIMKVNATNLTLNIEGDVTAEEGESKTASIQVSSSDQEILSVSGVIQTEGIDRNNLKVESTANWKMTYNPETGNFIIFNEVGAKNATIANITYVNQSDVEKMVIRFNNINITTIDYEETNLGNQEKTITIKGATKQFEKNGKIVYLIVGVIVITVIILLAKKKGKKN